MAQFDFLGTWTDSWAIIGAILETGDTRLVPDLSYEDARPFFFSTVAEMQKECLKGHRSSFIFSDSFSRNPPYLRTIEAGVNQGRYSVDISRGGPLLHLVLPACHRYNDEGEAVHAFDGGPGIHLAAGIVSYQRRYLDPESNTWEAASKEVKAGFKEVVRRIKSQLVYHSFQTLIWTGKDALREIQENKASIHGFGLN